MGRVDKHEARAEKLDPATWIPRREAARILNVSLPTILRWEGPRFRITSTHDNAGRVAWFVNAEDVECVRLERLGPTMAEIEAFVLTELAAGRTASEIVRSRRRDLPPRGPPDNHSHNHMGVCQSRRVLGIRESLPVHLRP
jgi:hypothetical protein